MYFPNIIPHTPIVLLVLFLSQSASTRAAELLTPEPPLRLSGTKGKFDFLAIDADGRRLLAAHTGNGTLDVIDIDKNVLIKSVPTGAAQDCAIDREGKRYLVSVSKPPQLAIVDAEKLEVTGKVSLEGPGDLLAFHAKSGHAYVGHDDGKELWVVSPAAKKVVATVELPSDAPEGIAFDAAGKRAFQAMKLAATVAVIDAVTNKVVANWPTAPAQAPHGIAIIPETDAIAIAGGNGKLVLMSQSDGKILSSVDMPERVDQIAFDTQLHRLYCASALGRIAIFSADKNQLNKLGEVVTSEGAKSIVLDPKTHSVWTAYAKGDGSFVQAFSVGK